MIPPAKQKQKEKEKEKHRHVTKEEQIIPAAPIPDLEMWSEYKFNKMAEESRMD